MRRTSPARGPFGRVLDLELDTLTLTKELEHGAPDRASMKEVLDTRLVADESEPLVDEKASDGTRRHTRVLRKIPPSGSQGTSSCGRNGPEDAAHDKGRGADLPNHATPAPARRRRLTLSLKTRQV